MRTLVRMDRIKEWREKYAEAYQALLEIDNEISTTRGKGYSLTKLPRKKLGYVYYVRYNVDGADGERIEVPTKFTTYTNDREAAELYARLNRDRLIKAYYNRRENKSDELHKILLEYYKKGSAYLEAARNRGRVTGEKSLSVYRNFIKKVFVPYLEKNNIRTFAAFTPPVIAGIQDYLLSKGIKSASVNRYLGSVKLIFDHLIRDGVIKENPFDRVKMLKAGKEKMRGCYELNKLSGLFKTEWKDKISYLLCALIYTTGLRNSEIERMRVNDIIQIKDCYFIQVNISKTENGKRLVPLHSFVYEKVMRYIKRNKKVCDDYIFTKRGEHNQSALYKKAAIDMGACVGYTEKELENKGISFYSGRHFYKTMLSAAGLGEDVEEYFMGHSDRRSAVSADVKKRYNHLDKRGEDALLVKAGEVCTAAGGLLQ